MASDAALYRLGCRVEALRDVAGSLVNAQSSGKWDITEHDLERHVRTFERYVAEAEAVLAADDYARLMEDLPRGDEICSALDLAAAAIVFDKSMDMLLAVGFVVASRAMERGSAVAGLKQFGVEVPEPAGPRLQAVPDARTGQYL